MSGSKLDKVKAIVSERATPKVDSPSPVRSDDVQLVYLNELEKDIKNTETFSKQADKAIKTLKEGLEAQLDSEDSELETKIRILALHDTYSKISYVPSKNDVIGISTASKDVNELIGKQAKISSNLLEEGSELDDQAENLKSLINDYNEMLANLEKRIQKNPSKLEGLSLKENKIQESEVSLKNQLNQTKDKLSEASRVEKHLQSHLNKIVAKFLSFQHWSNEDFVDEEAFKRNIRLFADVINKLVENLLKTIEYEDDSVWLEIQPSASDESLINILLRNGILVSRQYSSSESYYLKLRKYGIEF